MTNIKSHKLMEGADNLDLIPCERANTLGYGFRVELRKLLKFLAMWNGKI